MKSIQKYWRLFWHFRRLQLMKIVEYRANFLFWVTVTLAWAWFNLIFSGLLVKAGGGTIAGWNEHEMYLLVGVFTIIDAMMWSFMYHNMAEYTKHIFQGTLSTLIVKPANLQFVLMTQTNTYTNIFRIFFGVGIVLNALHNLGVQPSLSDMIFFTFFLIVAILFIYFFWFILTTGAFWVDRLDNINEVMPNIQRLWRFPRSIFSGLASTVFTVIFPFGLISSLPSEVLLGQRDYTYLAYFTCFTIGLFFFGRWFFAVSLKKYSGVGG